MGIDRAIRLVEQLLVLAREEAGTGQTSATDNKVDLQEVVKLAISDVLPLAGHKRIDLGLAGKPPLAPVRISGQPEALRILLRNLLENAVKYTPAAGQVDVFLQWQADQMVLTVEDSGPGIEPGDRQRVFDRFFRISAVTPESGSGLGLAIVKVIAERHGATLALDSSARLGGLKVEVRFPLAALA